MTRLCQGVRIDQRGVCALTALAQSRGYVTMCRMLRQQIEGRHGESGRKRLRPLRGTDPRPAVQGWVYATNDMRCIHPLKPPSFSLSLDSDSSRAFVSLMGSLYQSMWLGCRLGCRWNSEQLWANGAIASGRSVTGHQAEGNSKPNQCFHRKVWFEFLEEYGCDVTDCPYVWHC